MLSPQLKCVKLDHIIPHLKCRKNTWVDSCHRSAEKLECLSNKDLSHRIMTGKMGHSSRKRESTQREKGRRDWKSETSVIEGIWRGLDEGRKGRDRDETPSKCY